MRMRSNRTRAVGALGATAALTCTGLGLVSTAASAATMPTVTVKMSNSAITLSGGGVTKSNGVYVLHAGRIHFHVVSVKGDHVLNILHLRSGYSQQQAEADFPNLGNTKQATQNVYNGVAFRGGSE